MNFSKKNNEFTQINRYSMCKKIVLSALVLFITNFTLFSQIDTLQVEEIIDTLQVEPTQDKTIDISSSQTNMLMLDTGMVYYHESEEEIRTLFGHIESNGGYGALSVNYTNVNNKGAITMGAKGGWIINHTFTMGLGGQAIVSDYFYSTEHLSEMYMAAGYGGLFIESILFPKSPIHVSIPIFFGVGGAGLISNDFNSNTHDNYDPNDPNWEYDYDDNTYSENSNAFIVVEPGVEIELNMTRFFRLCFGGYYRMTSRVDLSGGASDQLNGLSAGITLKLGKF